MQLFLWFPTAFYVLVMPILFISWVSFFRQDHEMSAEDRHISFFVIAIATLLWPIVIPFAYLELLEKFKRSNRNVRLYQRMIEISSSQVV
jgi:hypothetical protein